MGILEKLAPDKIDPRIPWWLIFLVVLITYVIPLGLPVRINDYTVKAYNYIDKLPSGSIVLYSIDMSAAAYPEEEPAVQITLRHLMQRGARVMLTGVTNADAAIIGEMVIKVAEARGNIPSTKKYGVDYVNIGFIPGGEITVAALASDFKKTVKADLRGTPAEQLPLLAAINDQKDVALLIVCDASGSYAMYVRHWTVAFKKPTILFPTMTVLPETTPYYASGQFIGLVPGLRGAAEYEKLMGSLGFGTKSMDMLSMSHILVLGLMVVGNLFDIQRRLKK